MEIKAARKQGERALEVEPKKPDGESKEQYEHPQIRVFIWDESRSGLRAGSWGPPWHNWAARPPRI
jgi:hypothetical protein